MTQKKNSNVMTTSDIRELFYISTARYSTKPAFMQYSGGKYRKMSYGKFREDVLSLGVEMYSRGYAGKKIVILGNNGYYFSATFMAVVCGVGVAVPVSQNISPRDLAVFVRHCGAGVVMYSESYAKTVANAALNKRVKQISFTRLPSWITKGKNKLKGGETDYIRAKINENEAAAIFYNKFSDGIPKGITLSHKNLCFAAEQMCKSVKISQNDVFLSVLPLSHSFELTCGFLAPFKSGACIAYARSLRKLTADARAMHPTKMLCVPFLVESIYHKIWENIYKNEAAFRVKVTIGLSHLTAVKRQAALSGIFSEIHGALGGHLTKIICGCSALSPEIVDGMRDFGFGVISAYTVTECGGIVAINSDRNINDSSVGKSLPDAFVDIYNMDECGVGEIRYRGEGIMLGYHKQKERTDDVIHSGWYYTGDLGYIDRKGFLHLTGQHKNTIITTTGKQIFPEELENMLYLSEFVKEAVVVGIENQVCKELDIVAVIYPNHESFEAKFGKNYSTEQVNSELSTLIDKTNSKLADYKKIDMFVLRDAKFEKTPTKKIKRAGIINSVMNLYNSAMSNFYPDTKKTEK